MLSETFVKNLMWSTQIWTTANPAKAVVSRLVVQYRSSKQWGQGLMLMVQKIMNMWFRSLHCLTTCTVQLQTLPAICTLFTAKQYYKHPFSVSDEMSPASMTDGVARLLLICENVEVAWSKILLQPLISVRPILCIGEYSLVALQHRRIRYIGLRVSADAE